jgi:anaerobic ribonucleoside-triphosphate reductase activating protein
MMNTNNVQVAAYLPRSRANGPGLRSVVWVQGCPFRCPGCCNPDFLSFAGGRAVPAAEVADWLLAEETTEGASFSGGEPFAQAAAVAAVAERVRAAGKGVLIFTGFWAAALHRSANPHVRRLLAAADLLVAGPYQRDQPGRHPLLASAHQELVFLTERYRAADFGPRRTEFRIGTDGALTVTGLPLPGTLTPEGDPHGLS